MAASSSASTSYAKQRDDSLTAHVSPLSRSQSTRSAVHSRPYMKMQRHDTVVADSRNDLYGQNSIPSGSGSARRMSASYAVSSSSSSVPPPSSFASYESSKSSNPISTSSSSSWHRAAPDLETRSLHREPSSSSYSSSQHHRVPRIRPLPTPPESPARQPPPPPPPSRPRTSADLRPIYEYPAEDNVPATAPAALHHGYASASSPRRLPVRMLPRPPVRPHSYSVSDAMPSASQPGPSSSYASSSRGYYSRK
jgi:hypothetical protein